MKPLDQLLKIIALNSAAVCLCVCVCACVPCMVSFIVTHIAFGSSSQTHNMSMGVCSYLQSGDNKRGSWGHIRLKNRHPLELLSPIAGFACVTSPTQARTGEEKRRILMIYEHENSQT